MIRTINSTQSLIIGGAVFQGHEPLNVQGYLLRDRSGNEPIRDWLKGLDADTRRIIGEDLLTVQYGWPVGMPLCKSLGKGLYEVRSDLPMRRQIARLIFFQDGEKLIVVEGFIKKTQRTPDTVLKQAKARKGEHERNIRK